MLKSFDIGDFVVWCFVLYFNPWWVKLSWGHFPPEPLACQSARFPPLQIDNAWSGCDKHSWSGLEKLRCLAFEPSIPYE